MPTRRKEDGTIYRPYDANFHPQELIKRMKNGEDNISIASAWNIHEDTFYDWRRKHSELNDAYKLGLGHYERWFIENQLKPMMDGTKQGRHAFNAAMALAGRKLKWYKDGTSPSSTNTTQININNVNVNKSISALKEDLIKDLEYLTDVNIIDAEIVDPTQYIGITDESSNTEAED